MHNRVHNWVGGSMVRITWLNDPVFLHHCFIDKLWADWQVLQPQLGGARDYSPFLPTSGARQGHKARRPCGLSPSWWLGWCWRRSRSGSCTFLVGEFAPVPATAHLRRAFIQKGA
jgi:hypothetical protein